MEQIVKAADSIRNADAILIGAGAGMGVDSGLPEFRGNQGFWNAYPPFKKLGLSFYDLANPRWFSEDPCQAWGFYGHRMNLYRETDPHLGFEILRKWSREKDDNYFVFTSNVDGQFQRAGFNEQKVFECHGSIEHLQCAHNCSAVIWPGDDCSVHIDFDTMRAGEPLPDCKFCGRVARPNILMFGDYGWQATRSDDQQSRYGTWLLEEVTLANLVIIELGAGTSVPTVRYECERLAGRMGGTLIRINPREPETPARGLSIQMGALTALQAIDECL